VELALYWLSDCLITSVVKPFFPRDLQRDAEAQAGIPLAVHPHPAPSGAGIS